MSMGVLLRTVYMCILYLVGICVAIDLTRLDLGTGVLEVRRLRAFFWLGVCVAWARAVAAGSAPFAVGVREVADLAVRIVLPRGVLMVPIVLVYWTVGGIGGGDLRYLAGLVFWLPVHGFYPVLAAGSLVHVLLHPIFRWRGRRWPLAPVTPFLPALNLAVGVAAVWFLLG